MKKDDHESELILCLQSNLLRLENENQKLRSKLKFWKTIARSLTDSLHTENPYGNREAENE